MFQMHFFFISFPHTDPYQPFKNRVYKPFTSLSFASTHAFTIMCKSHDIFSSSQKIGPRIAGSMITVDTYAVVFPLSCTVSLLPIVGIGVEYGHQICPISLHIWNNYLLPFELAGLECDPHHVIFRFRFSNRTQMFLSYLLFFGGGVAKECIIVGLAYPV